MDNIAHTLVGAALGRAVADRRAPYPALVGAFAANLPDIIERIIAPAGRRFDYLTMHRAITHSLVGAAGQIAVLTLAVGGAATWWARRQGRAAPSWRWILALIAAAVSSHLVMDWQGSYGLRPFLPWSDRWYYGDWVAIVDPFFWLVPLVALVWGERLRPVSLLLFATALAGCNGVVLSYDDAASWLGPACVAVSLAGLAGWARLQVGPGVRRAIAAGACALLVIYTLAQAVASIPVKRATRAAAERRFGAGAQWATLTDVGRPFDWEPVVASRDTVAGPDWALARHLDDPRVRAALATERGRAIAAFARFLVADVDSSGTGVTVFLRDARYARTGRRGWAAVTVRLAGE
ncbi:MAG: hypothetical protein AUI55_01540 [Gemmatimonadetes bacterium 13_1_40CM_2_70_7]|nr:MAG: hypothetical protein AUI55_01540 [Gemmatimonadetes bacterium 13_1_40CM_2_70_7]